MHIDYDIANRRILRLSRSDLITLANARDLCERIQGIVENTCVPADDAHEAGHARAALMALIDADKSGIVLEEPSDTCAP